MVRLRSGLETSVIQIETLQSVSQSINQSASQQSKQMYVRLEAVASCHHDDDTTPLRPHLDLMTASTTAIPLL